MIRFKNFIKRMDFELEEIDNLGLEIYTRKIARKESGT